MPRILPLGERLAQVWGAGPAKLRSLISGFRCEINGSSISKTSIAARISPYYRPVVLVISFVLGVEESYTFCGACSRGRFHLHGCGAHDMTDPFTNSPRW